MADAKPLDHVGIIDEVRGDTVYYININGNDHDKVTRQSMSVHSSSIAYWLRPITEPDCGEIVQQIKKKLKEIDTLVKELEMANFHW